MATERTGVKVPRALFLILALAHVAAAQAPSPDRQFWADFVPSWRLGTAASDELEISVRTAWQGAAPTQYWATNTLEWNATSWLGLDAIGALVESRGPQHGAGYFEMRPSFGTRFAWRGDRVRLSEFVRIEHRTIHPRGGVAFTIERFRHRPQVLVALNHPSLSSARTAYLIADSEWFFVHDGHGGWESNQLRLRAGLGFRWNTHRSFEAILNDTRRRTNFDAAFEDGDHVLRLRWREAF
jgi:hypothetical protein